jgi:hypothetical protein
MQGRQYKTLTPALSRLWERVRVRETIKKAKPG